MKELFTHNNRRQSHGCVRVQYPRELVTLLLQRPLDWVNQTIAAGLTQREALPAPIPVFFVYQTVVAERGGEIRFLADVYHRDLAVWNGLFGAEATILQYEPPAHGLVGSDDGVRRYALDPYQSVPGCFCISMHQGPRGQLFRIRRPASK